MNSEIIMVLEKHIQQNRDIDMRDFETENLLTEVKNELNDAQPTDQVLLERLEALPPEKKEALLELLG